MLGELKPRHGLALPLPFPFPLPLPTGQCNVCCSCRRDDTGTGLARVRRCGHNWRSVPSLPSHKLQPYHGTTGYTGNSVPLKIIIAFFLGLALYNALELIILAFVTFQHYHGLYFWSLVISAFGIIPYSLGFIIKFFRLLDPNANVGYVAIVFLTIGWYTMVTGMYAAASRGHHQVENLHRD